MRDPSRHGIHHSNEETAAEKAKHQSAEPLPGNHTVSSSPCSASPTDVPESAPSPVGTPSSSSQSQESSASSSSTTSSAPAPSSRPNNKPDCCEDDGWDESCKGYFATRRYTRTPPRYTRPPPRTYYYSTYGTAHRRRPRVPPTTPTTTPTKKSGNGDQPSASSSASTASSSRRRRHRETANGGESDGEDELADSSSIVSEIYSSDDDDDDYAAGYVYFDWTPLRLTLQVLLACHLLGLLLSLVVPAGTAERCASSLAFGVSTLPTLWASPLRRVRWSSAVLALWAVGHLLVPPLPLTSFAGAATSHRRHSSLSLPALLRHTIGAWGWDVLRLFPHALGTTSSGRVGGHASTSSSQRRRGSAPWSVQGQPPGLRLGFVLAVMGVAAEALANWQQRRCHALLSLKSAFTSRESSAPLCYCFGLRRFAQHPHLMGQVCLWSGVWRMHAASLVAPRDPTDCYSSGIIRWGAARRCWRAAAATAAFLASVAVLVAQASGRHLWLQNHHHGSTDAEAAHLRYGYGVDPLYTRYVNTVPLLFGIVPFDHSAATAPSFDDASNTAQKPLLTPASHANAPHTPIPLSTPNRRTDTEAPERSHPTSATGLPTNEHSEAGTSRISTPQKPAASRGPAPQKKKNKPATMATPQKRRPVATQRSLPLPKRERGGASRLPSRDTERQGGPSSPTPTGPPTRRHGMTPPSPAASRDASSGQTPSHPPRMAAAPTRRHQPATRDSAKLSIPGPTTVKAASDQPRGHRPLDDLIRWHALLEQRHEQFDWNGRREQADPPLLRVAALGAVAGDQEKPPSDPEDVPPQPSVEVVLPKPVIRISNEPLEGLPIDERPYDRVSLQALVDAGVFVDFDAIASELSDNELLDRWLRGVEGNRGTNMVSAESGPSSGADPFMPRSFPMKIDAGSTQTDEEIRVELLDTSKLSKPATQEPNIVDEIGSDNDSIPGDVLSSPGVTKSEINVEELDAHPSGGSLADLASSLTRSEAIRDTLSFEACHACDMVETINDESSEVVFPDETDCSNRQASEAELNPGKISNKIASRHQSEEDSFHVISQALAATRLFGPGTDFDVINNDDISREEDFDWFDDADYIDDEAGEVARDTPETDVWDVGSPESDPEVLESAYISGSNEAEEYSASALPSRSVQGKEKVAKVKQFEQNKSILSTIVNSSEKDSVTSPSDRSIRASEPRLPTSTTMNQHFKSIGWGHPDGFRSKTVPLSSLSFADSRRVRHDFQDAYDAEAMASEHPYDFRDVLKKLLGKRSSVLGAELLRLSVLALKCMIKIALWVHKSINVGKRITVLKHTLGRVNRLQDLWFVDLEYVMKIESETDASEFVFDRFEGLRVRRLVDLWNVDLEAEMLQQESKPSMALNDEPVYQPWSNVFESLRVDRLRELWLEEDEEEDLSPSIAPPEPMLGLMELWLIDEDKF